MVVTCRIDGEDRRHAAAFVECQMIVARNISACRGRRFRRYSEHAARRTPPAPARPWFGSSRSPAAEIHPSSAVGAHRSRRAGENSSWCRSCEIVGERQGEHDAIVGVLENISRSCSTPSAPRYGCPGERIGGFSSVRRWSPASTPAHGPAALTSTRAVTTHGAPAR